MAQAMTVTAKRSDDGITTHGEDATGSPRFFSYLPQECRAEGPPLVFVHGYNRSAREQLQLLRPLANRLGRVLIAPYFSTAVHPRYQRLGRSTDGQRADSYFDACLRLAADELQIETRRSVLIGFSGGAQFAHRYSMLHPARVEKLIAVAAGWYTFPDCETAYPRGLDTRGRLRRANLNPESFLSVPTTVIVGEEDTDDANLRRGEHIDRQQGRTRVERARRWVLAMRMAARRYGIAADIVYQEVPGMDHDFGNFVQHGRLRELLLVAVADGAHGSCAQGGGDIHAPAG